MLLADDALQTERRLAGQVAVAAQRDPAQRPAGGAQFGPLQTVRMARDQVGLHVAEVAVQLNCGSHNVGRVSVSGSASYTVVELAGCRRVKDRSSVKGRQQTVKWLAVDRREQERR